MSTVKNTFYKIVLNVQNIFRFQKSVQIKKCLCIDKWFIFSKNDVVSNCVHVFVRMDVKLKTLVVISKNVRVSKNIWQFVFLKKFKKILNPALHYVLKYSRWPSVSSRRSLSWLEARG